MRHRCDTDATSDDVAAPKYDGFRHGVVTIALCSTFYGRPRFILAKSLVGGPNDAGTPDSITAGFR